MFETICIPRLISRDNCLTLQYCAFNCRKVKKLQMDCIGDHEGQDSAKNKKKASIQQIHENVSISKKNQKHKARQGTTVTTSLADTETRLGSP